MEGNFVHDELMGQTLVSGSVNWAKVHRHFKLEPCATADDNCHMWIEMDPSYW